MKIIVSACLLGHNCKYNGGNNRNQDIIDFVRNHEILALCPELLGGLSTPRQPAEIQNGIVINVAGESVDTPFRKGAQAALEIAIREKAELAILQPRRKSAFSSCMRRCLFCSAHAPPLSPRKSNTTKNDDQFPHLHPALRLAMRKHRPGFNRQQTVFMRLE